MIVLTVGHLIEYRRDGVWRCARIKRLLPNGLVEVIDRDHGDVLLPPESTRKLHVRRVS